MTMPRIVIPGIARNRLLNKTKADSSAFAPKEVLLGDGFGMTGNSEMAA
jgi:hypothetical protein